jgi:hypothetical protein
VLLTAIDPIAVTPTETLALTATELLPTAAASTRLATPRPRTAVRSRVVLWAVVGIALLVGAVMVIAGADDGRSPLLAPTTAVPAAIIAPTTVAPAPTLPPQPVVDCAPKHPAGKQNKHGREAQLQAHCG